MNEHLHTYVVEGEREIEIEGSRNAIISNTSCFYESGNQDARTENETFNNEEL